MLLVPGLDPCWLQRAQHWKIYTLARVKKAAQNMIVQDRLGLVTVADKPREVSCASTGQRQGLQCSPNRYLQRIDA